MTLGSLGLADQAPFDKIIAAASASAVPQAWKDQLETGGRIVTPILNSIFFLIKNNNNQFIEKEFPGFVFVPLVSDQNKVKQAHWEKQYERQKGEI